MPIVIPSDPQNAVGLTLRLLECEGALGFIAGAQNDNQGAIFRRPLSLEITAFFFTRSRGEDQDSE